MSDSTSDSPQRNQLPSVANGERCIEVPAPHYGDCLDAAERLAAPFRKAVNLVVYVLAEEFTQNLNGGGLCPLDVASDYGHCVSDVMAAALFLAQRRVIQFSVEPSKDGECDCISCRARRGWMCLNYDSDADYRAVIEERSREAEQAQREAARIVNSSRVGSVGFVYLIKCGPRHKIGITTDMDRRMEQLRGQSPYPLEIVHHAQGSGYTDKEADLHRVFRPKRVHGEWFELSPDDVARAIESMNDWARRERS